MSELNLPSVVANLSVGGASVSSGNPIPVQINILETVRAVTGTSDTILSTDWGKLVTYSNAGAIAVTLPVADATSFFDGWFFDVVNLGAGAVTVTPTTSTIQGAATWVLSQGEGGRVVSDGANYFYQAGTSTADPTVVKTTGNQSVGGVKTFTSVPIVPASGLTFGATTISETEAGFLDGVTAGTAAVSKALVLSGAGAIATIASATITTLTTGSIVATGHLGAVPAGVTAAEYGDSRTHQSVLTVSTTLPAITGGVPQAVGKLLYTFPAGAIIVDSAYMTMAITQSEAHINADTPKVGLGSVIGTGAVSVLNGTGTFMDIITEQTAANCTGTATVKTANPTAGVPFLIESGGVHTVHFNAAASWTALGDSAATLAGTVVLNWRFMA